MHINMFSNFTALTAPVVAITTTNTSTAGYVFTLTCTVTVVGDLVVQPKVEWVDSESIMDGVSTVMNNGRVFTLDLVFNPLNTSHGGQYTCRATIDIESINITNLQNNFSHNVIVRSETGCYINLLSVQ